MVLSNLFSARIIIKSLLAISIALQSSMALPDSNRTDFDVDDDGLIEIFDVVDLNEIRNSLDGASLYGVSTGCPSTGCSGFELASNLNFDTDDDGTFDKDDIYWNNGAGWELIGNIDNPFTAVFEGNNFTISNLYIRVEDELSFSAGEYSLLFGALLNAVVQNTVINGTIFFEGGIIVEDSLPQVVSSHSSNSNVILCNSVDNFAEDGLIWGGRS
ncbi:hypothetical protein [Microbulbifer epialgicus]|uniref:Uncharacterized protein n=1 Tax=Microbulbifer epialgicus TaxID=393907 RepID=A0ABV4P0T1_9GAMM